MLKAVGVNRVSGHQDAFRLLDQSSSAECSLELLILGEPLQGDVDRALKLGSISVHDVGEHAALCRFADVRRVLRR
jgi:hypothetical protein